MSRKRHRAEEIVAKLRQVEVLTAQGRPVAEAIRSIGVTEVSSGTSCSTARSSPRSRRPRSSLRAGVGTTTPFDRTRRSAPSRPRRRSYCGRRSFPNQLRRPPRPWRSGLSCTNTRPGPLHGGRPGERLVGFNRLSHIHKKMMVAHVRCRVPSTSNPHVPETKPHGDRTSDPLALAWSDDVDNSVRRRWRLCANRDWKHDRTDHNRALHPPVHGLASPYRTVRATRNPCAG